MKESLCFRQAKTLNMATARILASRRAQIQDTHSRHAQLLNVVGSPAELRELVKLNDALRDMALSSAGLRIREDSDMYHIRFGGDAIGAGGIVESTIDLSRANCGLVGSLMLIASYQFPGFQPRWVKSAIQSREIPTS